MRATALGNLLNPHFYSPHQLCGWCPHLLLSPDCPGVGTALGAPGGDSCPVGEGKRAGMYETSPTCQVCVKAFAMVGSFGPQYPGKGDSSFPFWRWEN